MSDFQKAKILVTAVYKNGEVLHQDHAMPARVSVLSIPDSENFQELNIRLAVNKKESEELLEGLIRGTVSLLVEQMLSPVERN